MGHICPLPSAFVSRFTLFNFVARARVIITIRQQRDIAKKKILKLYFDVNLETPVFTSTPPSSISISSIGASVRFNCSARGSPLPQITWYKKNVIVPTVNNVTADVVTSELAIGRFQPSDQATYTCVARNVYSDEVTASTKIGKAPMKSSVSCCCSCC